MRSLLKGIVVGVLALLVFAAFLPGLAAWWSGPSRQDIARSMWYRKATGAMFAVQERLGAVIQSDGALPENLAEFIRGARAVDAAFASVTGDLCRERKGVSDELAQSWQVVGGLLVRRSTAGLMFDDVIAVVVPCREIVDPFMCYMTQDLQVHAFRESSEYAVDELARFHKSVGSQKLWK